MKIRHALATLALLCALALCCVPARAQMSTYSTWGYYTELSGSTYVQCRMRATARVYNPAWGQTYRVTNSGGRAWVSHNGAGGFRMEALHYAGLGSTLVSQVRTISRFDAGLNRRFYAPDSYLSNWYPSYDGPIHYELTRAHPYGGYYSAWVYVSPTGYSHLCDVGMTAALNEHGYLTRDAMARGIYFVRP